MYLLFYALQDLRRYFVENSENLVTIFCMKLIFFLVSLFGIAFFGEEVDIKEKPLYFAPPSIMQHLSLGYNDFMANLLWLRYLQSADFCSFEKGVPVYKGDKKHCELGWGFRMVDSITELAPRFNPVYTISASVLSVFTGDIKGAEKLLLKGLKYFPNDWQMNLYISYLYTVDINNPERAAYHAYKAAENGGPEWLYNLSAKKHSESGNRMLGEMILQNLLKRDLSEKQRRQVEKQLKELREGTPSGVQ